MKATYWQQIPNIIGPATRDQFHQIGQKATRDALEAWILDHSDASTRLLDAGCNTGVEGVRLFDKKFPGQYVGADSNLKALGYAMANLQGKPASFAWADLEQIAWPDGAFDVVLNKDVVEHAAHYEPILRELARLTKTWLVLSMFIRMHDEPDLIRPGDKGLHHNRYRRAGLYALMESLGFEPPQSIFEQGDDEVLVFRKK